MASIAATCGDVSPFCFPPLLRLSEKVWAAFCTMTPTRGPPAGASPSSCGAVSAPAQFCRKRGRLCAIRLLANGRSDTAAPALAPLRPTYRSLPDSDEADQCAHCAESVTLARDSSFAANSPGSRCAARNPAAVRDGPNAFIRISVQYSPPASVDWRGLGAVAARGRPVLFIPSALDLAPVPPEAEQAPAVFQPFKHRYANPGNRKVVADGKAFAAL